MDPHEAHRHLEPGNDASEYAKLLGVIGLIALGALGISGGFGAFDGMAFMRWFMGLYLLVFAAFKLADLPGFVSAYIGYDVIAKRFPTYAAVYPFIELTLGLLFVFWFAPGFTLVATLAVMSVSSISVLRELFRGSKIRCACLGTVVRLPLTTVSLVEDLGMAGMAAAMLALGAM